MTETEKIAQRLDYVASKTTSEAAALIRSQEAKIARMDAMIERMSVAIETAFKWLPEVDKKEFCQRHADALRDAGVIE